MHNRAQSKTQEESYSCERRETCGSRELLGAGYLEHVVSGDVISDHPMLRLLHPLVHPLQRRLCRLTQR